MISHHFYFLLFSLLSCLCLEGFSNEYDKPKKAPVVVWEGSYLDLGSLSLVNCQMTKKLDKYPDFELCRVLSQFSQHQHKPLCDEENKILNLQLESPSNAQVTIRHAWPPNWNRPKHGKWVHIQPWEFGSIPKEWVQKINDVDEVWCPSTYVKKIYVDSGIPENKVFVVPNGINSLDFHPKAQPYALPTSKKYIFLFLGATISRKGPDLLLKAYLEAFTNEDDVCLVIKDMGNCNAYIGQTYDKQIKMIQKLPNAPEIIYLNQEMKVNEIAGLYTATDCLVYPYRGEGFALPVLEAMGCGLPVIVTAGGATDDFVCEKYGWLIPSEKRFIGPVVGHLELVDNGWVLEPNVEALAKQMRWALEHSNEGKQKGMNASQYVKDEWTWEQAAQIAAVRLQGLLVPNSKQ